MPRSPIVPLALLTLGCGGPSGVEPATLADLAGRWTATAITVTNELDPSLREDLFALGVRWDITIAATGAFTVVLANPLGTETQAGQATVLGDSLIFTTPDPPGPPLRQAMHYVLSSGQLALTWLGTEQCGSFGWQAAQCPIPATFRITAERE